MTEFQIGPGTLVTVGYAVYDAENELVPAAHDELDVVFGYGQLLPELEQALAGASPGQKRSVTLAPERAFGFRDESKILEVDRDDFPAEVSPGDHFEAEAADGSIVVLKVLDVDPERVVVDSNHVLADQCVRFELSVKAVRPATEPEIEAAQERLREPPQGPVELIAPERLLRSGSRRYDTAPEDAGPEPSKPTKAGRMA